MTLTLNDLDGGDGGGGGHHQKSSNSNGYGDDDDGSQNHANENENGLDDVGDVKKNASEICPYPSSPSRQYVSFSSPPPLDAPFPPSPPCGHVSNLDPCGR